MFSVIWLPILASVFVIPTPLRNNNIDVFEYLLKSPSLINKLYFIHLLYNKWLGLM